LVSISDAQQYLGLGMGLQSSLDHYAKTSKKVVKTGGVPKFVMGPMQTNSLVVDIAYWLSEYGRNTLYLLINDARKKIADMFKLQMEELMPVKKLLADESLDSLICGRHGVFFTLIYCDFKRRHGNALAQSVFRADSRSKAEERVRIAYVQRMRAPYLHGLYLLVLAVRALVQWIDDKLERKSGSTSEIVYNEVDITKITIVGRGIDEAIDQFQRNVSDQLVSDTTPLFTKGLKTSVSLMRNYSIARWCMHSLPEAPAYACWYIKRTPVDCFVKDRDEIGRRLDKARLPEIDEDSPEPGVIRARFNPHSETSLADLLSLPAPTKGWPIFRLRRFDPGTMGWHEGFDDDDDDASDSSDQRAHGAAAAAAR
jgi:hypothetical protein